MTYEPSVPLMGRWWTERRTAWVRLLQAAQKEPVPSARLTAAVEEVLRLDPLALEFPHPLRPPRKR